MSLIERLDKTTRLFLDSAPIIYFVERNKRYLDSVREVFRRLDAGLLTAITSPVTLAECLVFPYRLRQPDLIEAFIDRIAYGSHTEFVLLDEEVAQKAAELRARYGLSLTDAFQVAVALAAGCDALLTNDAALKRVTELDVLVLNEMEPG